MKIYKVISFSALLLCLLEFVACQKCHFEFKSSGRSSLWWVDGCVEATCLSLRAAAKQWRKQAAKKWLKASRKEQLHLDVTQTPRARQDCFLVVAPQNLSDTAKKHSPLEVQIWKAEWGLRALISVAGLAQFNKCLKRKWVSDMDTGVEIGQYGLLLGTIDRFSGLTQSWEEEKATAC